MFVKGNNPITYVAAIRTGALSIEENKLFIIFCKQWRAKALHHRTLANLKAHFQMI